MDLDLVDYEPEIPMEGSLFSTPIITTASSMEKGFNWIPVWSFHPQLNVPSGIVVHSINNLKEVVISSAVHIFL